MFITSGYEVTFSAAFCKLSNGSLLRFRNRRNLFSRPLSFFRCGLGAVYSIFWNTLNHQVKSIGMFAEMNWVDLPASSSQDRFNGANRFASVAHQKSYIAQFGHGSQEFQIFGQATFVFEHTQVRIVAVETSHHHRWRSKNCFGHFCGQNVSNGKVFTNERKVAKVGRKKWRKAGWCCWFRLEMTLLWCASSYVHTHTSRCT